MTLEQALGLTYLHLRALEDPETARRLRDGDLRMMDIIGVEAMNPAQAGPALAPNINDGQSTHNASVHKSASESATRLYNRYYSMLDGPLLEQVILKVLAFAKDLSSQSEKNNTAKRCILRLTDPFYAFTDPGSQISIRILLALSFIAISDRDVILGDLEDAKKQFIEGLYEIQRGYNLSHLGLDLGGIDQSICSSGTFNKFLEKLQGIHPDCEIQVITRETTALKLPIITREEAMRYMLSLASPNILEELQAVTHLMSQVQENGIEVIFERIKATIANRIFDEFGSLYRDRADLSFTDSIDACQYIQLPDLCVFQEPIQNSKGYRLYCSQILRQSSLFFSDKKSREYLCEHRHVSAKAQRDYDQNYGLILR